MPETLGWLEEPSEASADNAGADSGSATHEHPTVDWTDRPLAISGVVGFGTPVGLIGAVADYSLVTPLAIGVGAGTNTHGLQLAGLLNFRPFTWTSRPAAHAISMGAAYATGRWRALVFEIPGMSSMDERGPDERALDHHQVVERAHWIQADLGYELRIHSGLSLRTAYGLGWMLNPGDATCERNDGSRVACGAEGALEGTRADDGIRTASISLGYAVDL